MSQVQGPPPTITGAEPSNQSLLVSWDSDPYSSSPDATLLIINTASNIMSSVLLDETQIAEGSYLITGLTNGDSYSLLFSVLDTNGNSHNSNTFSNAIPSDIPQPPTIDSYTLSSTFTTVNVAVTLGENTGLAPSSLIFRILHEGFTITSQAFSDPTISGTYTLSNNGLQATFVQGGEYIISCQALNAVGYSNVSNSISFKNDNVPPTPALGQIVSGSNSVAILPVSGTNTSSSAITTFQVFNNGTPFGTPYSVSIAIDATYNLNLTVDGLSNETPYSFSVKANNSTGASQASNVSTVVPAIQLVFESAEVTFPSSNQITVTWTNNAASWLNPSRDVILGFSGTNVPSGAVKEVFVNNQQSSTYQLPSGQLVAGDLYTVTVNGYCLVPQIFYPSKWVTPTLTNYQYPASQLTASATYATTPGAVSNITYSTDIIDNSGIIQFSWTAAPSNGSPITGYLCKLYSAFGGELTPVTGQTFTTTATNFTFYNLSTTIAYAIGITAQNVEGNGPETFEPDDGSGIIVSDAADAVSDLTGVQISYTNDTFYGKLAWNYQGAGNAYTDDVSFNVYSVVNNVQTFLTAIEYIPTQIPYTYSPINLGTVAGSTKEFVVYAVAKDINGDYSTSTGVYIGITTGLSPIISSISIEQISSSPVVSRIKFTVTNSTSLLMIADSILTFIAPNPASSLPEISDELLYQGYDASLVDLNSGSYEYIHEFPYEALGLAYTLITAANGYGATAFTGSF